MIETGDEVGEVVAGHFESSQTAVLFLMDHHEERDCLTLFARERESRFSCISRNTRVDHRGSKCARSL